MDDTVLGKGAAPEMREAMPYTQLIDARLGEPISSRLKLETSAKSSSPGLQLMEARKALDWTVEKVAAQLNLATRQILAMEADDYAALPGVATTRGFFRLYAKLLKLDATPLLALIPSDASSNGAQIMSKRDRSASAPLLWVAIGLVLAGGIVLIKLFL